MIVDISYSGFKNIFHNEELYLPKRWDGRDFISELRNLFDLYIDQLQKSPDITTQTDDSSVEEEIRYLTNLIIQSTKDYLDGYPQKAYDTFAKLMSILDLKPFVDHTLHESFEPNKNPIILYRAAKEKKYISRTRMFHTPYNMRFRVPTCRYSIAGFPCLYLGTSLELCFSEIREVPRDYILASAFQTTDSAIIQQKLLVFDLAVKPQDFESNNRDDIRNNHNSLNKLSADDRCAYLLWYPLIAACSFIRAFPSAPFAAEYIIPQLFMQWIRKKHPTIKGSELTGVRYFSCASIKASDMGYNYVFPTSGEKCPSDDRYCKYLIDDFSLTEPVFVHDYPSKEDCEDYLNKQQFDLIVHNNNIEIS